MTKFVSYMVESITSFLLSLIPRSENLPIPSQKTRLPSGLDQPGLQLGLKTLIHSEEPNQSPNSTHNLNTSIVHCYTLTPIPKIRSSPPPSLSSFVFFRPIVTDDVIGTESGDYMTSSLSNIEGYQKMAEKYEAEDSQCWPRYRNLTTKQIPPPLSILRVETGYLPGRMTWVFERGCNEDGRLIIRAEGLNERLQYLVPHRENGRLVMKLVPPDDAVCCEECGEPLQEEEEQEEEMEDMEFDEEEAEEYEDDEADEEQAGNEDPLDQKWCLDDASEHEPCEGFTYGGGTGRESDPYWEGNRIGDGNGYLGQPGCSSVWPMTTVM